MFVIEPKTNRIKLTKSDTATILVEVYDVDHIKYEIKPTDTIRMTVRQSQSSAQPSLEKLADSDHIITILSSDTSGLQCGNYVYDIELTTNDGYKYTVVPTSYFQLTSEVSR